MSDNVVSPISVEAEIKQYTLVGDDIYVKRYDANNIPAWYRQMIEDILTTDPTITDINGAIDFLTGQGVGFNQSIYELNQANLSINTSLTTLVSQVGENTAGVGELWATKVDSTSATAIAQTVVASEFNTPTSNANAWFSNKVSTYASQTSANTTSIQTLSSTLDDITVSLTAMDSTLATVNGWAGSATKLLTGPNGEITGWRFADGTNVESTFDIYATNFKITDGTTGYTPFSISGGNINFNGKVQFSNVLSAPTINKTWIQTSQPTTGMVAGDTWVDTDDSNKTYTYNGTSWVLNALGAKTYYQSFAPSSNLQVGDIWINSGDNNKTYRWNGSQWDNVSLSVASGNKTYYQTAAPTVGLTAGDIWYDSDDGYKMYRWSGSAWQSVNETTISGNRITTGVINANLITAGTLKVGYLEAEKLDVTYMKPNHNINIIASAYSTTAYYATGNSVIKDVLVPATTNFTIPSSVPTDYLSPLIFTFQTTPTTPTSANSTYQALITVYINGDYSNSINLDQGGYLTGSSGTVNADTVIVKRKLMVKGGDVISIRFSFYFRSDSSTCYFKGYNWTAEIQNKGTSI